MYSRRLVRFSAHVLSQLFDYPSSKFSIPLMVQSPFCISRAALHSSRIITDSNWIGRLYCILQDGDGIARL
jgi:hypothetical protein